MKMDVVRIHKLDGTGPTKAFVDVELEGAFIVKGLRIVEGKDGLFVSLPREEGRDGKWYSTVVPVSREVKETLDTMVLEAYNS